MATDRRFVREQLRQRGFKVVPAEAEDRMTSCAARGVRSGRVWSRWTRSIGGNRQQLAMVHAARERRGHPFVATISVNGVLVRDAAQ